MTACMTVDQVIAAALRDSKNDPPLNQEQTDLAAALLAPHITAKKAA